MPGGQNCVAMVVSHAHLSQGSGSPAVRMRSVKLPISGAGRGFIFNSRLRASITGEGGSSGGRGWSEDGEKGRGRGGGGGGLRERGSSENNDGVTILIRNPPQYHWMTPTMTTTEAYGKITCIDRDTHKRRHRKVPPNGRGERKVEGGGGGETREREREILLFLSYVTERGGEEKLKPPPI